MVGRLTIGKRSNNKDGSSDGMLEAGRADHGRHSHRLRGLVVMRVGGFPGIEGRVATPDAATDVARQHQQDQLIGVARFRLELIDMTINLAFSSSASSAQ